MRDESPTRTIHEYVDLLVRARLRAWHFLISITIPILFGVIGGSSVVDWVFQNKNGDAPEGLAIFIAICSFLLLGVLIASATYPKIWMVFLSTFLAATTLNITEGLSHSDSLSGVGRFVIGLILLSPTLVVSVLSGFFIVFVRRTMILQQVIRTGLAHCPECRYSLEGLDGRSATCPECGLNLAHLHSVCSPYRFRLSHFVEWK